MARLAHVGRGGTRRKKDGIEMGSFNLILGDCIEVMEEMPDDSVDSIVTDPPYELGFMGKSWDSTGIAFDIYMWQQALRVLKPGGHLISFSSSRTYHRMAVAIEDAGFEIRDQIMWVYGSGFPKSHNVAKAITATELTGGSAPKNLRKTRQGEDYKPTGQKDYAKGRAFSTEIDNDETKTVLTNKAQQWEGWGTALKPAHEPIVLARKPFTGTVANNVLAHGTGGINIDGCRVGSEVLAAQSRGVSLIGTFENAEGNITPERTGRFPANFIHDGSDEVLALFPDTKGKTGMTKQASSRGLYEGGKSLGDTKVNDGISDSGSAARFFYCAKTSKKDRNEGLDGFEAKSIGNKGNGLSRVCASCGIGQLIGCECPNATFINPLRANFHPTVKPTDLMRYLVRLVTPPNGTVLDPFMGSGSTGKAAILEGFDFIGIDMTPEYVEIARARITHAQ